MQENVRKRRIELRYPLEVKMPTDHAGGEWALRHQWRRALACRAHGAIAPAWRVLGTSCALLAALCGGVHGQTGSSGGSARGQAPAAAPAPTPSPPANPIRQAAEQRGFAACGPRVEQVTNFLGFGPAAGAFLMAPAAPPGSGAGDQRLLPLVMEIPLGPTSAIITASFAASPSGGGCGATYDAIVYWPQPCEVVAASQFASLRRMGMLKRDVLVLDGGPATKVFLMSAGAGCVSVKKEVVL